MASGLSASGELESWPGRPSSNAVVYALLSGHFASTVTARPPFVFAGRCYTVRSTEGRGILCQFVRTEGTGVLWLFVRTEGRGVLWVFVRTEGRGVLWLFVRTEVFCGCSVVQRAGCSLAVRTEGRGVLWLFLHWSLVTVSHDGVSQNASYAVGMANGTE